MVGCTLGFWGIMSIDGGGGEVDEVGKVGKGRLGEFCRLCKEFRFLF